MSSAVTPSQGLTQASATPSQQTIAQAVGAPVQPLSAPATALSASSTAASSQASSPQDFVSVTVDELRMGTATITAGSMLVFDVLVQKLGSCLATDGKNTIVVRHNRNALPASVALMLANGVRISSQPVTHTCVFQCDEGSKMRQMRKPDGSAPAAMPPSRLDSLAVLVTKQSGTVHVHTMFKQGHMIAVDAAGNSVIITLPPNVTPWPTGYYLVVNLYVHTSGNKTFVVFEAERGSDLFEGGQFDLPTDPVRCDVKDGMPLTCFAHANVTSYYVCKLMFRGVENKTAKASSRTYQTCTVNIEHDLQQVDLVIFDEAMFFEANTLSAEVTNLKVRRFNNVPQLSITRSSEKRNVVVHSGPVVSFSGPRQGPPPPVPMVFGGMKRDRDFIGDEF